MTVMESSRPTRSHVHEEKGVYVIDLDVSDFEENEVSLELVGNRLVVRGNQAEALDDESEPFELHERREESLRLPADADTSAVIAVFDEGVLEVRVPRRRIVPRAVPVSRKHRPQLVNPNAYPC